jgi:hypothetical protein
MVRFALSLAAAAVIAVSGYAALGAAAHTTPLKVIAVVVAHGHHSSLSALHGQGEPVVQ